MNDNLLFSFNDDENEESTLMYLADEETAYVTSAKVTNQLRELLLSE